MTAIRLTDTATQIPASEFDSINTCLVLAPHPDDESLGCGGLAAMLRKRGKEVFVVFITDGSLSHPNSKQYPADVLIALRKGEAIAALSVLDVAEKNVFFLNKKDGSLPVEGEDGFKLNAGQLHLFITLIQPDLVLVPYEKDPHRDHRATWQMLEYAHRNIHASYRILEYIVWLIERGEDADMPEANTVRYINISLWRTQKQEAIRRHLSQITKLIDDDPNGFTLSEEMLRRFDTNKEYYICRDL